MRDLITILAILLLLVLTAALAVPYFVDWDSRRAEIGQQLSAALGQDIRIDGPIGLTLLPTPSFKLGHVTLGDGGVVSGRIGRIRARAAIPPLLRGEVRITAASLDGARLIITAGGRAPFGGGNGGALAIDRLALTDSDVAVVLPGGGVLRADDMSGTFDATAIDGPYRGTVNFGWGGVRRTLRFSTGRIAGDAIRLRAMTENEQAAARAEYDGTVSWAGGVMTLDGRLSGSGNADVELGGQRSFLWRAETQLKGGASGLTADQIELAVGPSDRQVILSGNADVTLGGGVRINATLAARQVDLDKLLAADSSAVPTAPEALLRAAAGAASRSGFVLPVSGRADITIGSLLLGGGVIAAPRFVLTAEAGAFGLAEASAELPGRAQISLRRDPGGEGPISAEVRDAPAFLAWLHGAQQRATPVRSLAVEGRMQQSAGGLAIADAAIRADDMRFAGSIGVNFAGERPKVTLALTADQLDIAKLPDMSDGAASAVDIALKLDATRVRYRGVGAGAIRASLDRKDGLTTIQDLTVRDIGSANMRASGVLGGAASRLTADVDGQQLDALLELLDRLMPHAALPQLKARAAALAPARLSLRAEPAADGHWRLAIQGGMAGTTFDGALVLEPGGGLAASDGLKLDIEAPSAGPLLRKLGLPAIDAPGAGPLRLTLAGAGPSQGTDAPWSLHGRIGGTTIGVAGSLKADPAETFAGRISIESQNISPLAQTLLVAVPKVPPGQPMRLDGGLDLRGYRITIRDMRAAFGQTPVTGEIAFNLAEFGRVAGQLRTSFFDAAVVAPLIFGFAEEPGVGWAPAAFPSAAAATLPGDLWIEADRARILDGLTVERSSFVLRFDNGLLFLEHAAGRIGGTKLQAQGTLRRSGRAVSLAGKASVAGDLPAPGVTGDGEIEFTAIGESPAQLVGALSGGGALRHRGLALPTLLHSTFADLAAPRERGGVITGAALAERLKAGVSGRLPVPAGETRLTLAGGVLRLGPVSLHDGHNGIMAGASYDLRTLTMGGRMDVVAKTLPKGWTGPPPQVSLMWRGSLGRPALEVEADEFANGLTALAIQRETERIEALEQDQRERAFFNRRLRAAEDERRAEEERQRAELLARLRAEREQRERQQAEEALRGVPPITPLVILPPPMIQ